MLSKLYHQPIEGNKVRIRLLEDRDAEQIRAWRNQPHIRMWYKHDKEIETHEHQSWYEKYKARNNDYLYIVESRELNWKPIGQLGIYKIDWTANSAEFGWILVGEEAASGKGLMYEAACLLIELWTSSHGIENYLLEVKADNARAIRLYSLLGFQIEQEKDGFLTMRLCFERSSGKATKDVPSVICRKIRHC